MKPERRPARLFAGAVAAAVVGAVIARFARALTTEAVAGESMRPTLTPGDWLVVRRGVPVRPGDIVVARRPDRTGLRMVKRVTGRVDGGWWLEGDNPAASHDSWVFGAVPGALIEGRAVARYWPVPALLVPTMARRRAR